MLSKRKAMIGYAVYTLGKPLAKRKLRQQQAEAARKKKFWGSVAAAAAAAAATFGGLMFWRRRRSGRRGVGGGLEPADTVVVGAGIAGCAVARLLAETGERVLVVDRGGIGAGASGRNGGFLFRQPAAWIGELLDEAIAWYGELEEEGTVPLDLREWPMLLLAVEEAELAHARAYAEAVGGEEVDLREDPWLADDLAGGFVVEGGVTLDALGATTAAAEAARRAGARFALGCEVKRILVTGGRVAGVATDAGVVACGRAVVAAGPRLRFLLRTAGTDLPVSSSRGWLLETGRVDPPPRYAIEQAGWPEQEEMGALVADPTLGEVAAGAAEEPGLVSAPPRRPSGRPLPDRDVAAPLAPGGARRRRDGPAPGRARRARRRRTSQACPSSPPGPAGAR